MRISDSDIHIVSSDHAAINFKLAYGLNDIPLTKQNVELNSTGVTFQLTDRLLVQRDMLWCGPTTKCTSISAWKRMRAEYVKNLFPGYPDISLNNLKTDLLYNENRLNEVEFIYIWAGTNLEDQLLILFVIYLVKFIGGDFEKIRIIQFESLNCYGETLEMFGMSHLDPNDMQKHPEPIALLPEQIKLYQTAWDTFTSDTPFPLMQFLSLSQTLNKHLAPALQFLLRRYPRIGSGLDYWETKILSHVGRDGNSAGKIIADAWGENIDGDVIGEVYLLNKILHLGNNNLPEPLLELSEIQQPYLNIHVTLTEFGVAVINGEASFYPPNPIDKWIGGVHLSSATGNLWFYQNGYIDTIPIR